MLKSKLVMTYFMFVLLRPRRNDREQFQRKEIVSLIFTQFWSRSHLSKLDQLTPQDVYYLCTWTDLGYPDMHCLHNFCPFKRKKYLYYKYMNIAEIESEIDLGGRLGKQNRFSYITQKPLKLELSCKNNMFYPISQLFKSKRRGL